MCTIGHAGSGCPVGGEKSIVSTPLPRGMQPAESHTQKGREARPVAIGKQIGYPLRGSADVLFAGVAQLVER